MANFGHELHYFSRWDLDPEMQLRASSDQFWRALCPDLTISADPFGTAGAAFEFPETVVERAVASVRTDGYLKTGPALEPADAQALASAVRRVIDAGFHPLFASVYDEYWKPLARLGNLLTPVFEAPPRLLGDYWLWCVSVDQAPAGWSPHRDHEVENTIHADGRPSLLTVWIPFTDATPENGCIYAVPRSREQLALQSGNPTGLALQDVLAIPARAGSIVAWNQDILHWGGRCTSYADGPRISTGIYFQSSDVADYRRGVAFDAPLPFASRLELIAAAFWRYHSVFEFPSPLVRFVERHAEGA
jgi:hypothetical protein